MLKTLSVLFISNGTAKRKLAILPFLYCGELVKNLDCIINWQVVSDWPSIERLPCFCFIFIYLNLFHFSLCFRISLCILMDDVIFILSTATLFLLMFSTCAGNRTGKTHFTINQRTPNYQFPCFNLKPRTFRVRTKSPPWYCIINSNECIVKGSNIFDPKIFSNTWSCLEHLKKLNALIMASASRSQEGRFCVLQIDLVRNLPDYTHSVS